MPLSATTGITFKIQFSFYFAACPNFCPGKFRAANGGTVISNKTLLYFPNFLALERRGGSALLALVSRTFLFQFCNLFEKLKDLFSITSKQQEIYTQFDIINCIGIILRAGALK